MPGRRKLYTTDLTKHERKKLEQQRERWYKQGRKPDRVGLRSIDYGEWCWLMRFRANMTLKDVADTHGVSDVCVIEWETQRGNYARLVEYWMRYYGYSKTT